MGKKKSKRYIYRKRCLSKFKVAIINVFTITMCEIHPVDLKGTADESTELSPESAAAL